MEIYFTLPFLFNNTNYYNPVFSLKAAMLLK